MASRHTAPGLRVIDSGNGTKTIELRSDTLAQPTDGYHADWYSSDMDAGSFTFVFAKLSVTKKRLVTVLSVTLPSSALPPLAQSLVTTVVPAAGTFEEGLEKFLAARGRTPPPPRRPIAELVDLGTKEHSVVATIGVVGYSDNDGVISFYRLPPGASLALLKGQDLSNFQIMPVVRIDTSANILLEFCRDVRNFADSLK